MRYFHYLKSSVLQSKGIISKAVGLALPADLDRERWDAVGADLCRLDGTISWWVGDWWIFGEHRYGARREITEDPGWQGPAYQTCANSATVCRAFEISRRREALSFSHHETVAALPTAEQDRLLDLAEREGWSRHRLRCAVKSDARAVGSIDAPTRQSVIVPTAEAVDCTDLTTGSARRAESELACFLAGFKDTYGAMPGFGPVIERMLEARAILSRIADAEVRRAATTPGSSELCEIEPSEEI
jgi:hypothetical protein